MTLAGWFVADSKIQSVSHLYSQVEMGGWAYESWAFPRNFLQKVVTNEQTHACFEVTQGNQRKSGMTQQHIITLQFGLLYEILLRTLSIMTNIFYIYSIATDFFGWMAFRGNWTVRFDNEIRRISFFSPFNLCCIVDWEIYFISVDWGIYFISMYGKRLTGGIPKEGKPKLV